VIVDWNFIESNLFTNTIETKHNGMTDSLDGESMAEGDRDNFHRSDDNVSCVTGHVLDQGDKLLLLNVIKNELNEPCISDEIFSHSTQVPEDKRFQNHNQVSEIGDTSSSNTNSGISSRQVESPTRSSLDSPEHSDTNESASDHASFQYLRVLSNSQSFVESHAISDENSTSPTSSDDVFAKLDLMLSNRFTVDSPQDASIESSPSHPAFETRDVPEEILGYPKQLRSSPTTSTLSSSNPSERKESSEVTFEYLRQLLSSPQRSTRRLPRTGSLRLFPEGLSRDCNSSFPALQSEGVSSRCFSSVEFEHQQVPESVENLKISLEIEAFRRKVQDIKEHALELEMRKRTLAIQVECSEDELQRSQERLEFWRTKTRTLLAESQQRRDQLVNLLGEQEELKKTNEYLKSKVKD